MQIAKMIHLGVLLKSNNC